jgi:alkanesulfonate monooxygenase
VHLHWFLPSSGDGRDIVGAGHRTERGSAAERPPDLDYLTAVATAVERLGFEAVLTPTGTWSEDSWIATAALIPATRRLRFIVALRPGLMSPTLTAQMAATFQRLSGGRVALNVVTGGDAVEQQRFGDWLSHDERYARTAEFLQVLRGAWSGTPYDHLGDHYRIAGATVATPPAPVPPVFFGGASPAAERVAAAHADAYLAWGEPPPAIAARIASVRGQAADVGRTLEYGVRLHVIARETSEKAWRVADDLLDRLDPAAIASAQAQFARSESVGQRRMSALQGGDLTIYPNLWAGFGLVRGGAGTALVGSFDEVAERINEYRDAGVDHFILSGYPHLEEAYWFGEGVLPELRRRGVWVPPSTPGPDGAAAADGARELQESGSGRR